MAVAACFGAVLAGSASFYTLRQPNEDLWAEAILKTHLRATLSGHVLDVASSDRHTVKPWFSGKTSVAPVVVDLASAGYPLLGGRLDIPETEPLPVLVYRAGPHLVSVTVRPASGDRGVTVANRDGFSIAEWREHGFAFSVVSDADANELGAFQAAFSHALRTLP
jgi:anti-sigma factor RsiW